MVHAALLLPTVSGMLQAGAESVLVDMRCGAYCLNVALVSLDVPVDGFQQREARLGQPSASGYSLGQLAAAAEQLGAKTLGVKTTPGNLRKRSGRFACIIPLESKHFVLLADVDAEGARLIDPPSSERTVPVGTLSALWDGSALLISREDLQAEEGLAGHGKLLAVALGGLAIAAAALCAIVILQRKGLKRSRAG